jgi:hypothetical protein
MYYDINRGVRVSNGLFSKRAVIIMVVLLVLAAAYAAINYFAPDIFIKSLSDKQAIEQSATTSPADKQTDILRIPSVGVSAGLSEKMVEGSVVYESSGNHLVLSAKQRLLGAAPWETVRLSPLYQLYNVQKDANIYVDIDGKRTVYRVKNVVYNTTLSKLQQYDLIINAMADDDPQRVAVMVTAAKTGQLEINHGRAEIRQ